jgi:hypothetical protein
MHCPHIDEVAYPSFVIIGSIGLLLSSLLLFTYTADKHLLTPPGPLIIGQQIYQVLFDLHYISGWPFLKE